MKLSTQEFEILFRRYKGDIYRIAYTYVNNEQDALDIVQETAYQAYISKDKLKDKLKFKSWLLTIAVNKSKDLVRKNKDLLLDDISSIKRLETREKESINMFMDNLKTLSLDEKNIIVLKIYFEYTFEIISKELKMPISTVKTKYYRALEKLKLEEGVYDRQA
ncbi:MAG: sigma-70 family RNA polymerase sigma factor [Tissierellia bacterium]|nr:sigma-70 family RNA polymerase sigma factor [Tissierellia bacterium]